MNNELLIWSGKPKYKVRLAFLELIGEDLIVAFVLPALFIFLIIRLSVHSNLWLTILFYGSLFVTILLPEIHKHYRRKHTDYQLTNQNVRINTFWYGKKISHIISLNDIDRFLYVNFKDDCGRIHLMTKTDLNINTRNFWSGSYHSTIALEDIQSTSEVYPIFIKTLHEFNLKKLNS